MNILTFDVEDWFHLLDHDSTRHVEQWGSFESRIQASTDRVLDLLAARGQKATFFCLGWVADAHPAVIRRIDAAGHEIGSHTYSHQLITSQTREAFAVDFRRSVDRLQEVTGKKIRAFRAPGFSLTARNTWAFEVIAAAGIEVDCSVFPASHAHGGFESFGDARPVIIDHGGVRLKEFPLNVSQVLGRRVVFSGGGYFRLFPYALIRKMMRDSGYVMTYFHPRDFDAGQPMLPDLPWRRRFRSYVGLAGAFQKLRTLLDDFQFVDLAEAERSVDWTRAPVMRIAQAA